MKLFPLLILAIAIYGMSACNEGQKKQVAKEPDLPSYFKVVEVQDTMRFEVSDTAEPMGDTLPNRFFFGQMDTRLMNQVLYFDNSAELIVMAVGRFPLTSAIEAYHVDMRQNWYQHQSLFLYDQQKGTFTERITLAEFYGGDGGQILTGSYLFDYDADGDKDIVRREIEHWLEMGGEEPKDTMTESATLLLWDGQAFQPAPADTAALVKGFPVKSMW